MHFHLFNCHGEWNALAMILANAALVLPLATAYVRSFFFASGGE